MNATRTETVAVMTSDLVRGAVDFRLVTPGTTTMQGVMARQTLKPLEGVASKARVLSEIERLRGLGHTVNVTRLGQSMINRMA